jgi:hypothetical protein
LIEKQRIELCNAGAKFVFAANVACFLVVVRAIGRWKQPTALAKVPSKSFSNSFGTVISYVRSAPGFQVVLARSFLFSLFISAIPALMSVLGLKVLHLSSFNLGLFFTFSPAWELARLPERRSSLHGLERTSHRNPSRFLARADPLAQAAKRSAVRKGAII